VEDVVARAADEEIVAAAPVQRVATFAAIEQAVGAAGG